MYGGDTPGMFNWPGDIGAFLSLWLLLIAVSILVGAVVFVVLWRWLRQP